MICGLLCINLGTPAALSLKAVYSYLNEFLLDKRVIDLPIIWRYLLVKGLILPFRCGSSLKAYKKIWLAEGSPLLYNTRKLVSELELSLAKEYKIALGMRYGKPSIASAMQELIACDKLIILPLYPQYSGAATGSAIEAVLAIIQKYSNIPHLKIISHFYQHPAYIKAQSQIIKENLAHDHYLLFSYHGVPMRQLKSSCTINCNDSCQITDNPQCYKAQCIHTSNLLAKQLDLSPDEYSSSFQSRLGKASWIKPYTNELLIKLAKNGVSKLTIVCPSFIADCLETLEEIGIKARLQWQNLGGEELTLIPALNSHPAWVKALKKIIQD